MASSAGQRFDVLTSLKHWLGKSFLLQNRMTCLRDIWQDLVELRVAVVVFSACFDTILSFFCQTRTVRVVFMGVSLWRIHLIEHKVTLD